MARLPLLPESVQDICLGYAHSYEISVLTLSKATKTVPSGSQTPTYDDMAVEIGNATRSDQAGLRAAVSKLYVQYCFYLPVPRLQFTSNTDALSLTMLI